MAVQQQVQLTNVPNLNNETCREFSQRIFRIRLREVNVSVPYILCCSSAAKLLKKFANKIGTVEAANIDFIIRAKTRFEGAQFALKAGKKSRTFRDLNMQTL